MQTTSIDRASPITCAQRVWGWAAALLGLAFLVLPAFVEGPKANSADATSRWWRGNMHTHTFWSDGDDFPETVGKWDKDHGYQFLVYTDHNVSAQR